MIVGTHYWLISFGKLFIWKETVCFLNHRYFYIHGASMDIWYIIHWNTYIIVHIDLNASTSTKRSIESENSLWHFIIDPRLNTKYIGVIHLVKWWFRLQNLKFRRSTSIQKLWEHSNHFNKFFKNLHLSCLIASCICLISYPWRFNANIKNLKNEGFMDRSRLIDVNLWTK